MQKFIWIHLLV